MLAQIWGNSSSNEPMRSESVLKAEVKAEAKPDIVPRSFSVDGGGEAKPHTNGVSPPRAQNQVLPQPTPAPQRTASTPAVPTIVPPSRMNSMQSDIAKRPRLTVQIPSENSDGSATGGSSPKDSSTTGATPAKTTDASHSSGVVLPPPSPSASALLSAGASGPPNPFARPAPPHNPNFGSRGEMDTPISALPSRFVADGLLPSPSSFYPEWGFGRDSNMLPSPLTFQTPIVTNGPSFRDDDERKRKTSEGSPEGGIAKKIKA